MGPGCHYPSGISFLFLFLSHISFFHIRVYSAPFSQLEKLRAAFAVESGADDIQQMMLSIIESIVDEANVKAESSASEENNTHLSMILEKLGNSVYQQPKHKKAAKAMMRILPFLTYGAEKTSSALVDFFKPHLDLEHFKEGESFFVEGFEDVASNIKQDTNGQKLREFMVEHGMTSFP